jgi:hypothetical protein
MLWFIDRTGGLMTTLFPEPIRNLPEADIPLKGITAYLSQGSDHQILFMAFEEDVDLPPHAHAAQIGIVLEGRIDLIIGGKKQTFTKGDRYYIPEGVEHSGTIYGGYADITFFNEPASLYAEKSLGPYRYGNNRACVFQRCPSGYLQSVIAPFSERSGHEKETLCCGTNGADCCSHGVRLFRRWGRLESRSASLLE